MVLVTGGAGFIGSHVVDRLVDEGYCVRVVDNLSTGRLENISGHLKRGKVDFVEGDVREASVIEKSVEDVDAVVHLAAVTSVPFSVENPSFTFDVNVMGTLNLLRSCAKRKVGKLVYVSSFAVYGEPEFLPVSEAHPTNPISPYAESKLAAEKFCLGLHEKGLLKSVVLRLFNVYGHRQGVNDYCGVIMRFIECCRGGAPLVIYGDGSQTRDFVYVEDVAEAILSSIKNNSAEGEVFNIGFGKPVIVRELAEAVLELAGLDLEIFCDTPRVWDIKRSYADISKAEEFLGYKPKVSLRDGLRALLANENIVVNG